MRDFTRNDLQDLLVQTDDAGRLTGGYLKNYYDKRQQWRTSDLDAVLARVYGALLADVHQELRALSIERVVFMPNLGLSLIPLHACYRDGESGRDYLLDHYDISYAPSFGLLRHATERAADEQRGGRSLFAVADPERNLKWAGVEVARIAEFFPQHRILGGGAEDRATLQAVSEEMPGHAYVHFACHGLFDPGDPLRSRLALTPDSDPLTLKTILLGETSEPQPGSISRVGPFAWPRARLAVMSACETGLVDPSDRADESFGLAAGLLLGGVPAVVSTLWAVDDRSTALLMQRFYLYLVRGDPCRPDEGPLSIASALRRAQSWLRDEATSPQGSEFQAGAQSEGDLPVGAAGTDHAPEGQAHRHQQRVLGNHGVHALSPEGSQQTAQACRFASPYYWAAFTVTGAEPRASGLDDER